MTTNDKLTKADGPTDPSEASLGSMLQGIGSLALIGGIVLSMLQGFIDLPIKGVTLGYLMIGGIIVAGIGAGLKKFKKSDRKQDDASN